MDNNVIFKASNGRLVIILEPLISFEELKSSLEEKLLESKQLLSNLKTVIQFKGRFINEQEELELIKIINQTIDIEILFVTDGEEITSKVKDIEKVIDLEEETSTEFHLGTLRSGEVLDCSGNVVVLGDVNPGSIIKAQGNIVIMGTLSGIAHAGTKGDAEAFIVASNMNPIQLRIDDVLYKNYNNSSPLFRAKQRLRNKSNIAYLRNNILVMETLTRKSLQNIVTI